MDVAALLWGSRRKKILLICIAAAIAFGIFANPSPVQMIATPKVDPVDAPTLKIPGPSSKNFAKTDNALPQQKVTGGRSKSPKKVQGKVNPVARRVLQARAAPTKEFSPFEGVLRPPGQDIQRKTPNTKNIQMPQEKPVSVFRQVSFSDQNIEPESTEVVEEQRETSQKQVVVSRAAFLARNLKRVAKRKAASSVDRDEKGQEQEASAQSGFAIARDDDGLEDMPVLKYGDVQDEISYVENTTDLPDDLQRAYEHLHVFAVVAGNNASKQMIELSVQKYPAPLYRSVAQQDDEGMEKYSQVRKSYRFPPDWKENYVFSQASDEEKIAFKEVLAEQLLINLGTGGSMVFEVVDGKIDNGAGMDFVIWGRPRCVLTTKVPDGSAKGALKELLHHYMPRTGKINGKLDVDVECVTEPARVSVAVEGPSSTKFEVFVPCKPDGESSNSGCAGYGYNMWRAEANNFDYRQYGGDHYDLSSLGLEEIRAIKIEDLGSEQGFALDSIAMVHFIQE